MKTYVVGTEPFIITVIFYALSNRTSLKIRCSKNEEILPRIDLTCSLMHFENFDDMNIEKIIT